ncbi:MAG: aminotransferase class III-fold pyridoxal phosphate-dependent enzyme [Proteobacteria bacterium]|nr:MAG: aminotransferase class III-fold pyridoxal phosphate-dependent enzyme [Pseudomonadota bacterium]
MSKLVGRAIADSPKIRSLISDLTAELAREADSLSTVRDAQPGVVDDAKKIIDETNKTRGRGLFYPFVGTGAGHGPYVECADGSVKLDLINGIGVNIMGHSHPKVTAAAVRGALTDIVMQGNLEPGPQYHTLGKKLVELAGKNSRLKHAWFATCGTMANENALKLARQKHTPARFVVAMENSFAGRSTMMAEVTDNPAYRQGLPRYEEVLRIPFYDAKTPGSSERALSKLKEHFANHPKDISTFMFEPMLGEGGFKPAPREYFVPMLEFVREQKAAIWLDEVQTFMRTGELFAFEKLNLGEYVDLCTVAKTLQTGATLFTEEYNPQAGLIAGTFAGASSALAAGEEILRIITEEGYLGKDGKIEKIHKDFVAMLNRLNETTCKGLLQDAGGMGLMVAVTPLDGSKDAVTKLLFQLFKNGMVAFNCGRDPYRLRFLIPAVMEQKDIELAGKILEKSIQELA